MDKREIRREGAPVSAPRGQIDRAPAKIKDYYRWAFEQAALIRAGRFGEVDIENVAEEIEDVGKSDFRAFARIAARQTKLVVSRFPATCPYSWSDIMEKSYDLDGRS